MSIVINDSDAREGLDLEKTLPSASASRSQTPLHLVRGPSPLTSVHDYYIVPFRRAGAAVSGLTRYFLPKPFQITRFLGYISTYILSVRYLREIRVIEYAKFEKKKCKTVVHTDT